MFKAILASAAIAATSLVAPAAVEAAHHFDYCTTFKGIEMCANYGSYQDQVVIAKGGEYEVFKIRCTDTHDIYESNGHLTKAQASEFVEGYCNGRRGY
jgi:hypothetical protein